MSPLRLTSSFAISCRAAATPDFGTFITPPFGRGIQLSYRLGEGASGHSPFRCSESQQWLPETLLIPVLVSQEQNYFKNGKKFT